MAFLDAFVSGVGFVVGLEITLGFINAIKVVKRSKQK